MKIGLFDRLLAVKNDLASIYYSERGRMDIETAKLVVDGHSRIGIALDRMLVGRMPAGSVENRKPTKRRRAKR